LPPLNEVKQSCRSSKAQTAQAWQAAVQRPCRFSTKLVPVAISDNTVLPGYTVTTSKW